MNTRRVSHKMSHIRRNGQNVIAGARKLAENTQERYKEGLIQVKKHPARAVAAAVAIGLLLGRISK